MRFIFSSTDRYLLASLADYNPIRSLFKGYVEYSPVWYAPVAFKGLKIASLHLTFPQSLNIVIPFWVLFWKQATRDSKPAPAPLVPVKVHFCPKKPRSFWSVTKTRASWLLTKTITASRDENDQNCFWKFTKSMALPLVSSLWLGYIQNGDLKLFSLSRWVILCYNKMLWCGWATDMDLR